MGLFQRKPKVKISFINARTREDLNFTGELPVIPRIGETIITTDQYVRYHSYRVVDIVHRVGGDFEVIYGSKQWLVIHLDPINWSEEAKSK